MGVTHNYVEEVSMCNVHVGGGLGDDKMAAILARHTDVVDAYLILQIIRTPIPGRLGYQHFPVLVHY